MSHADQWRDAFAQASRRWQSTGRPPTIAARAQRDAWAEFLAEFVEADGVAVTLVYNPIRRGTAEPCFRELPDGHRVPIPTPGASPRHGVRRLAEIEVIPINVVHQDVDRLHRDVDRKLFGAKFNLMKTKKRTSFVGILEHVGSNIHVHLMWRVPPSRKNRFTEVLTSTWSTMVPGGSARIVPAADLGWAKYMVKDFVGPAQDDVGLVVTSRLSP